jgi:ABC-type histidine transport system ATPase subunit
MSTQKSNEEIIICENVNKWYGEYHALRDVSIRVKKGEVVVIFGPSGSGKSTFIRTINRLEEHQEGKIFVDNIEMTNDIRNIDAIRRETGMVFQQFNLFPHLTVLQNITLAPIWVRKKTRTESEAGDGTARASGYPGAGPQSIPANSRAASSSASRSPGPWRWIRGSCSSMSRLRRSTPR